MEQRKWTHMMFAVAGVILAWLLAKSGDWIWSYFAKPNSFAVGTGAIVVATIVTFIAWRNQPLFELANEVTTELRKVTWPDRKQTVHSTIVVIITTIVSAGFLGLFDAIWSWASHWIYG